MHHDFINARWGSPHLCEIGNKVFLWHLVHYEKKWGIIVHTSSFGIRLFPFEPIDGPANQYGQRHVPIKKDPYIEASIK